jgi:hypothetical protein
MKMNDQVEQIRSNGGKRHDRLQSMSEKAVTSGKDPRTIDFSMVLRRPDGSPQKESMPPSWAQIAQMAAQEPQSLISYMQGLDKQAEMTLARACEVALDVGLDADKNEGIKPKMQRGNLIDKINRSVEEGNSLVLKSEDVTLIKNRVGSVFHQASLVRQIVLMLDPAMGEE